MSVTRSDYVIYGVNVGYNRVDWDKFEAEIEGRPDAKFDLVCDSMCGKYAYAGKIIARSEEYEGFGDGVDLTWKNESPMAAILEIQKAFPDLNLTMNDFKTYVVTNFS